MEKIELGTPDITQENINKLIELFPQVATEVEESGEVKKAIDFDSLRDLLGDVVEDQRERYQFTWPGKREAKAEARRSIGKTMIPCPGKSVNWTSTKNMYIEGDNLDALKILRETYAGAVKLIYIDPPYNTGHDFIYDDDYSKRALEFNSENGEFDDEGGRLVANLEGNGRFHSDWCSMIYPRLLLARDLLSEDGSIFISIDDNEAYNLRNICNEIFGAGCFVADISWQKTYSPKNNSTGIPDEVEHIIAYSKSPNWSPNRLPRTEEMDSRYKSPDNDPVNWKAGDSSAPGAVTHQGMVYGIQNPFTGEFFYPPMSRCWSMNQDDLFKLMNEWAPYKLVDLDDAEERGRICGLLPNEVRAGVKGMALDCSLEEASKLAQKRYDAGNWPIMYLTAGGRGKLGKKIHLDDSLGGRVPTNYWPFAEVGHTDGAKKALKALFDGEIPFDTPKPVQLMDRIVTIASKADSLVLDFFSGSASMAEAVMRKNVEDGGRRQFVLVQIPEKISGVYEDLCSVGEERIKRAGKKITEEINQSNIQLSFDSAPHAISDIGFRVMRIDSSNFKSTMSAPEDTVQDSLLGLVDNVKEGRTELDLLFEILPKFRIPYSAPIEEKLIGGKKCLLVNGSQLIACFDLEVGVETIETIAKMQPLYAVMRDTSMFNDSAYANFEELFKTYSPDTVRRVI